MRTKKQRERFCVERIREVCPEFPQGEVLDHEGPDFLIRDGERLIGIELRGMFHGSVPTRRSRREVEGICEKILARAQEDYLAKGNPPVQVWLDFHDGYFEKSRVNIQRLAAAISQIVEKNVPAAGELVHIDRTDADTEEEYQWELGPVSILRPDFEDDPFFTAVDAGFVAECDPDYLQLCIDDKADKVPHYRRSCASVWLVLTVYGDGISSFFRFPDDVLEFQYKTGFDRVYIFDSARGKCHRLKTSPN